MVTVAAVVALVAAPVNAPTNVVEVTLVNPATVVTVEPNVSAVLPSVTYALANLACASVPELMLVALIEVTLAPDPLSVAIMLAPLILPVTAKLPSVPTEVMFVCAAVCKVPVKLVATTAVAPKLPTLALPVALSVPVIFAPVPVTVNTFAVPAELTVTLPLAATLTFDVPFCIAVASMPVNWLPFPRK